MSLQHLKTRSKKSASAKKGRTSSNHSRKGHLSRAMTRASNGRKPTSKSRRTKRMRTRAAAAVRSRSHRGSSARLSHRNGRNGKHKSNRGLARLTAMANGYGKDRVVLLVRDAHWLHAYWEVTHGSVQRAEAALREEWHGAKPILRVFDVSSEDTTSSSETPIRDIDINGEVNNWYIDVSNPPRSYRVDLGFLTRRGRFYTVAHSNVVTTPGPGAGDVLDENWANIQRQFDKLYVNAGSNSAQSHGDPKHLLEDRMRRPIAAPPISSFGLGAMAGARRRKFWFQLDAELIVYGTTVPGSQVSLQGEQVQLRPDGTFTMRFRLPDKRLIIPATASAPDGSEERTVVLAVERNTKELEPMLHEHKDD